MYNKYRNRKVNDKKVLHKVRKHWVVMSTALLMAIGGGALVANTNAHAATNPDDTDNNDNDSQLNNLKEGLNSTLVKNNQSMGSASSSATSTQSSSARIQDQARNLHTQILQNSIQHSNSSSNASNTSSKTLFGTQNVASNRPVKRQLGGTEDSGKPYDSTIYIQNYNSKTGQPIGDRGSDFGFNGQPWTNRSFYLHEIPNGYGYDNPQVKSDVTTFNSRNPQIFKVYWDPVPNAQPVDQEYIIVYNTPTKNSDNFVRGLTWGQIELPNASEFKGLPYYETNSVIANQTANSSVGPCHYNGQIDDDGTQIDGNGITSHVIFIGVEPGKEPNHAKPDNPTPPSPNTNPVNVPSNSNSDNNQTSPDSNSTSPLPSHNVVNGDSDDFLVNYVDMSDNHLIEQMAPQFAPTQAALNSDIEDAEYVTPDNKDYHYVKPLSDTTDRKGNTLLTLGERKNRMTINYVDKANNSVVKTLRPVVVNGTRFDVSKFEQKDDIPAGYTFANSTSQVPQKYFNGRSVNIYLNAKDTMNVYYVDPDNNIINNFSVTGSDGSFFNMNTYTNAIPTNYELNTSAGNNGIIEGQTTFTPNGTVKIGVKKAIAHMSITYTNESDGSIIKTDSIQSKDKAPFTFHPNVPSDYHFVSDSNVPKKYTDGDTINVTVAKNPSDVTVPIIYVDKNKNTQVGTANAVGRKGSAFDPDHQFEQDVPQGYTYHASDNKFTNIPSTYEPSDERITIYVTKDNYNPNPAPQIAHMTISYQYQSDGNNYIAGTLPLSDVVNQRFNVTPYEQEVPQGYADGQVDQSTNPGKFVDGQTVVINVKQLPVTMTVAYKNGNQEVGSTTTTGNSGKAFDPTEYENKVPAGYQYNGSNVEGPTNYTAGKIVTIPVQPVTNNHSNTNNNQSHQNKGNNANSQIGTITIHYVDGNNNPITTDGGTLTVSDLVNKPFDVDPYLHDVPQGYNNGQVSGSTPTDFTKNPQDVYVQVTKNQPNNTDTSKLANVTIKYEDADNGHVVNTLTASGTTTSNFSLDPYKNLIPNGYKYAYTDGTVPTKYDNSIVTIMLHAANNKPDIAHMTIDYINQGTNQSVGTIPISDEAGQSFKASNYTSTVPQGYDYADQVDDPTNGQFVDGDVVKVYVNPVQAPKTASDVSMPVNYVDQTTNQTVGRTVVNGKAGSSFEPTNIYEQSVNNNGYVPAGYKFASTSQTNPSTYTDGQSVVIYVTPKNQAPKVDHMTVNYVDPNGQTIDRVVASGDDGNQFDPSAYETSVSKPNGYMPAGYKFVGNNDSLPTNYIDGQPVNIEVAPTTQTPQLAKVTIKYEDADNGNSVNTLTASGNTTSDFDFNSYKTLIPSGYKYAYTDGTVPAKYNNSTVTIMLHEATNKPDIAHMTIDYINQQTNQSVGTIPVSDKAGQNFNVSDYTKTVPQGCNYANQVNDPTNGKFVDGDVVKVYVNPIQKPKVVSDVSMPVNYVDPNGQTIDRVTATGKSGSQFDPTAYETSVSDANGYMPAGYKFVGNNDNLPTNYIDGQSVNIEVAPKTQAPKIVHMTISYQNSDGGAQISSIPVTGTSDEKFDITPYTKMIPNTYQYDYVSQSSVPQNYTDNATPVIVVKKSSTNQNSNNKPAQKIAHMTIHYQVNGSDIENPLKISDVAGNSFDWSAFKKNVPAGHSYDNATATDKNNNRIDIPSTFTDGDVITINLTDNQPKQSVTSYVQYVDDNGNGQPVNNEIPVTGIEGQLINLQPYENDVPYGYSYSGTNSTPYYYKSGQTITIPVNANDVTMPVMYINPSDNTVFDRTTTEGAYGSTFDVTPYKENAPEGYLPSGYTVTGVDGVIPKTYDSKGSVELYAKSTQPKAATVTINYLDAGNNDKNINNFTVDAHEGEDFKIEPYTKTLPTGYETVSNDINNVVTNTNLSSLANLPAGSNSINILVKSIPSAPKIISMPVNYTYNNNVIGSAVAQGTSGSSFNDTTYENNVPNGYYYDNGQVQAPSTYASDQSVTVPVNKYANGTITVNYVDANGNLINSSDNSVNVSDQITRPFDATPYIKNVPQGYNYESIYSGNPKTFQSRTQTLDIQVKPAYATMNVQYVHDGKTVGQPSSTKIMGQTGQKVTQSDLVQYETDVPYGYIYRGQPVSGASIFENGKTISIDVDPIAKRHSKSANTYVPNNSDNSDNSDSSDSDNSRIVDIPVTYYSDAKGDQLTPVGYAVAQGFNGQVFDNIDTYTENVPQGYAKGHVMGVPPLNYKPNEQLNIIVSKNQPNGSNDNNSNNGNQENTTNDNQPVNKPQTVNMMLTYMSHSNVVGYNDTLQGIQGHSFNIDPYLMNQSIPKGYHYAGYVINGTNTYDAGRQIVVEVEPNNSNNESENSGNVNGNNDNYRPNVNPANEANQNSNSQLNNANMVVSYIYNGRVVGSNSDINGVQGSPFHLDPYLTNAPTGYQADYALNGTDHFENGKNIMVMVQPINSNSNNNGNNSTASTNNNQSNPSQTAKMTVAYVCNGYSVGTRNITGITGDPFDVTPYEIDVPGGYQNGTAVISPDEYKNGGYVEIKVQPVNPNNNGGNQQNFNGNGQPNNSGDRTTNGNGSTSNGQPNTYNPTNTNSYSPNYDPTVNVYTNGQKENPNINDNGSGERPKTNRGANTDPNHEQNNNGSASDQNQSAANQPSNQHTANSSKSDHSSSNASSGIVINNNPVINNHPVNSNTNEMNGNGGGQPSGDNGSHNHSSVPSSNYPNGNSTASNGSQPGNSASTGNHQSQSQSQSQTVNVNGGGSTDGNGANHTSQPSNEANDSGSAGHQPMSNGGSGSTANNFNPQYNPNNSNSGNNQQSQSGYINGNGSRGGSANDNGSQASNSNQPSNTNDSSLDSANAIINNDNSEINSLESAEANRSNGNDSAMSSTMARQNSIIASLESEDSVLSKPSGKTDSTVNNYYQSIINDDNSEIASLAGRSGNSSGDNGSAIDNYYQSIINNDTSQIASLESASANAAKNTGSGQNDSSMDSSMNRQTSIINSLESQATSTSNTDATTDNSYNSAIASLNSKLTSITNSANSENAAQNNRGQSQSSQSSTSSSGSKSSARASNSQPSGSNDSSVDSLSSEVASLKNRLNHQSSGPTTVNNYYGSGSSNNNVPSNGTQSGSTTNNYNPNNTFSPTNNQYPNSGDSTASNSSSQGIQQNGSTNSQPSASKVSHRSTKPGRRKADTTTTKRRRAGNKKANRRGAKTANDFNDLSLNSTDGRNFGNSVSHRNSRGTSSTPDNLSDGFGDTFSDGLNHRITADQNNATRRGRLPQTGESTNDRELAAIGSILAIVGTGLSQLGYALKRRRRRHFYADRRYDRYEN